MILQKTLGTRIPYKQNNGTRQRAMPNLVRLVHITHIYIGDKLQELLDLTLKRGGSATSDSLGRLEPSQSHPSGANGSRSVPRYRYRVSDFAVGENVGLSSGMHEERAK